jgi:hypothetical protein
MGAFGVRAMDRKEAYLRKRWESCHDKPMTGKTCQEALTWYVLLLAHKKKIRLNASKLQDWEELKKTLHALSFDSFPFLLLQKNKSR